MRRVLTTGLFLGLFFTFALSQDRIHAREGLFLKRIENNMFQGRYNLAGKKGVENLFFRDFNAIVEFLYYSYYEGISGFRIVRKNSSYALEIKYITNFEEVRDKKPEEQLKLYKVRICTIPISNQFAEKLYEKIAPLIVNFKVTEVNHPDIVPIFNGSKTITFRTVVGIELWSLWVNWPQGDIRRMADLCRQIITDAPAKKMDEAKYINILGDF